MKAVLLEAFGGPEGLRLAEAPDPSPAAGEAVVRVRACALNHLDLWVRQGLPAYKIRLPHVLGNDIAGEVASVGPGVAGFVPGDKVVVAPGRSCWSCAPCLEGRDNLCESYGILGAHGGWGGYAELVLVPARNLLPYPEGLSFEEAASFPLTFLTAWHMLMGLGGLRTGQSVLVLGAGSGVGVAAIQIARLAGARVLAASTSEAKLERARSLGADEALLSKPDELHRGVLKRTGGRGVDLVFEHVGGPLFGPALRCLRKGGTLVTCGATAGAAVELDLRYVFGREARIHGCLMGTLAEMRTVAGLVAAGRLKPVVDRTFPLAEAARAQEHLASGAQFGKVVLRI